MKQVSANAPAKPVARNNRVAVGKLRTGMAGRVDPMEALRSE